MASVINTNIAAIRTHNTYNRNNDYMNSAMTKVATGMKINSAKDGGSVWAISEKMRERIRANDQANQNVQNDLAMMRTAEGGVGNTIEILKTLKERAINAANDSNMNQDRGVIQTEINGLLEQIDDNAKKVSFNGRLLLDGKGGDSTTANVTPYSSTPTEEVTVTDNSTVAKASPTSSTTAADHSVFQLGATIFKNDTSAASNSDLLTAIKNGSTALGIQAGDKITISWKTDTSTEATTKELEVTADTTYQDFTKLFSDNGFYLANGVDGGVAITTDGSTKVQNKSTDPATDLKNGTSSDDTATFVVATGTAKVTEFSVAVTRDTNTTDAEGKVTAITRADVATALTALTPTAFAAAPAAQQQDSGSGGSLNFHIGGEANFTATFELKDMSTSGLSISGLDVTTVGNAKSAITKIDSALKTALDYQAKIGSYETRLGYTSDNLVTMNENLEAADSSYRDADIAKEMTNYMKYAVLSQASQYMLAQAGQNAFQVLNLLQP